MTTENKRIEGWIEGVTAGTPVESQIRFDVNVPQASSQIKVLYSGITHTFPSTVKTQAAIESRVPYDAIVTTQAQLVTALTTLAIKTIFINKDMGGLVIDAIGITIPDTSSKAIYGAPIYFLNTNTIETDPTTIINVYFFNDVFINSTAILNLTGTGATGAAKFFATNLNRPNDFFALASLSGTVITDAYQSFFYEYVDTGTIPSFTGTGVAQELYWLNTNTSVGDSISDVDRYENNLLVPLYINTGTLSRSDYEDIITARTKYSQVGITVIINPSDGYPLDSDPYSSHPNAAYTTMIDDLKGIGCVVIGYATTLYGGTAFGYYPDVTTNPAYNDTDFVGSTQAKIDQWYTHYPQISGIFLDEYNNGFDTTDFFPDLNSRITAYKSIGNYARSKGAKLIVGNGGTDMPHEYWENDLADVFIINESASIPSVALVSGTAYAGSGHEFINRRRKGSIVHTQSFLDYEGYYRCVKYCGYFYSTNEGSGGPVQWRITSNHILQQAAFFAQSMKDFQITGIQGNAAQVSPSNPTPKHSFLGYHDTAGGDTYDYNDTSANNWLFDGMHLNIVRDPSNNFIRYIDLVALGNYGGGAGGAELRIWTNSGSSRTAVIGLKVTKDADISAPNGNLLVETIGKGLRIKEGTNAKQGVGTIGGGGNVVIANTSITANSRIFITNTSAVPTVIGAPLGGIVVGVSFTVVGTIGDTFNWFITEPA